MNMFIYECVTLVAGTYSCLVRVSSKISLNLTRAATDAKTREYASHQKIVVGVIKRPSGKGMILFLTDQWAADYFAA